MSISTRHSLVPFIAGSSVAMTGQRLAKIGYKGAEKKFDSVCVSVPGISGDEVKDKFDALIPFVLDYLEGVQDKLIRSLYEEKNGALKEVADEEISIDQILGFLSAESTGGRLTKDCVDNWFKNSGVKDIVSVLVADKIGVGNDGVVTKEQENMIAEHVESYGKFFSSLSGGKTSLPMSVLNGLEKIMGHMALDESDIVGCKLDGRIKGMKKKMMDAQESFVL